jgi:hypothetical protein
MDPKLVRLYELEKCVYQTARELNLDLSECLQKSILDQPRFSSEYNDLVEYAKREGKRVINFFIGKKETIEEVDCDSTEFDFSSRDIISLKETVFPLNLTSLDISSNKLTSLNGVVFPPDIGMLNISDNQIKTMTGVKFPPGLTGLYMNSNNLSSFVELPPTLEDLDISSNKIKTLSKLPSSLRVLNCADNQIKSLLTKKGEPLPESLIALHISDNQLTSIEGLPTDIESLDIENNQVTSFPISMVHLRYLGNIEYSGNPIELGNLHPSVQRFIELIENGGSAGNTVYDDGQNVHNITVQNSVRESLNKLTNYKQTLTKSKLKEDEISFLDDEEVHSFFHFTQRQVLLFVENAIEINKEFDKATREQLYSLLREALREGRGVCSTGRIGRMVNVLSGFDDNVQIKISDGSQIGAIISNFRNRGETKENVEDELKSRGFDQEQIDLWLEHY